MFRVKLKHRQIERKVSECVGKRFAVEVTHVSQRSFGRCTEFASDVSHFTEHANSGAQLGIRQGVFFLHHPLTGAPGLTTFKRLKRSRGDDTLLEFLGVRDWCTRDFGRNGLRWYPDAFTLGWQLLEVLLHLPAELLHPTTGSEVREPRAGEQSGLLRGRRALECGHQLAERVHTTHAIGEVIQSRLDACCGGLTRLGDVVLQQRLDRCVLRVRAFLLL